MDQTRANPAGCWGSRGRRGVTTMSEVNATPSLADLLRPYREALAILRAGRYDLSIPQHQSGAEAALLRELIELAQARTHALRVSEQVQQIADLAVAGLGLEETLEHMFAGFRDIIPFDRLSCALLSDDGARVVARWVQPTGPSTVIREGFSAALAGSSLQSLLQSGEPRIINDLEAYLSAHPHSVTSRLVLEEGVRSSLTGPLIAQGKPLGFLFFSSWQKFSYTSVHQDIFRRIATQLSCLIERSDLYDRMEALNQRLTRAQGELQHQATHDALTGIFNRRAILQALEMQLGAPRPEGEPCGVILIDVDHFKQVNDRYGHQAGDEVLSAIAVILAQHLRADDRVGRYGGEEFLIVVGGGRPETVLALAERLRGAVAEAPIKAGGRTYPVTVSIGAGLAAGGTRSDTARLIQCADQALYQAKADGRNCVRYLTLS